MATPCRIRQLTSVKVDTSTRRKGPALFGGPFLATLSQTYMGCSAQTAYGFTSA